ncbi:MAG: ATPase [Nitratireductor sp.]|nr:ATPase [Nitratireductor sp.]MCB1460764.1 ATPase [Nitratireductor sp.]
MREILENLEYPEGPGDPVRKAQQAMKTPLPKRFYKEATVVQVENGFTIHLDGKPVRTPSRSPLVLPSQAAAGLVAAEWQAQENEIDPARMPVTRIANTAIDGIAADPASVAADIVAFAGTDLICYRAETPQGLVERQAELWDPVIAWYRDCHGANFILAGGISHVSQPDEAIAAFSRRVSRFGEPLALACLHVVTTLTGSALLAIALGEGRLSLDEAWAAAHVDEDWNIHHWGEDEEAVRRREARFQEMRAAARLLAALDP